MQRRTSTPRENWQTTVESQGLHFHTADGIPYWDESVYYELQSGEVDVLESTTYALNDMCLEAVQFVIDNDRFDEFQIPQEYRQYIRDSWDQDEHTIYGRFDLAYDGQSPPKLLEYNADTPTSLLEAAVIQWYWLRDVLPTRSQFNSIHERLLEAWQTVQAETTDRLVFTSIAESMEDFVTVSYLRDVAIQANFETSHVNIEEIGWDAERHVFIDQNDEPIRHCFKLYPWEWMLRETFGPHLLENTCRWFEPPWKAILSNKAILPVLWELYPNNPFLLEAQFEPLEGGNYVRKPIFGREGANVQIFEQGQLFLENDGPYDGPWVYQELCPLPRFEDRYFICIGSWLVNGWACGIGIREDESLITGNLSRFVPHVL
jgi:glutathionylspermidine synthase